VLWFSFGKENPALMGGIMEPLYKWTALGAATWYLVGMAYFAFYRRHRLVLSPEEAFAVNGGQETH